MVLKAKVDDGKTYFLLCRNGKVTGRQYIDIFTGLKPLPVGVSDVYFVTSELQIPNEYIGDFDVSLAKHMSESELERVLQELFPESFRSDFWVGSYCDKSLLSSSDGDWKEDEHLISYDYKRDVKVLRDDCVRHRNDVEYEHLSVDKETGLCTFRSRKYTRHGMETVSYVFDCNYKVWVEVERHVDVSIIGIKR